jgi:hypothetical protein
VRVLAATVLMPGSVPAKAISTLLGICNLLAPFATARITLPESRYTLPLRLTVS